MISIVLYGRNDSYGYNLHKRAALSLNCLAELLTDPDDEILFVDYNTPDDFPTFPEAIQDTLTAKAKAYLRILRVRPSVHARFKNKTHLMALEPVARNIAVRRSNPANRWILSTNTDMIFVPRNGQSLSEMVGDLPKGYYGIPRFELPESLWENLDRYDAPGTIRAVGEAGWKFHLNEIVYGVKTIKFDAPGDFQLIDREDLHRVHGFNEEMLVGWHVDSNLCKRLFMLYGEVGDLSDRLFGYHCDHTRQVTPMHRRAAVENSLVKFVDTVTEPTLPAQADSWGCADADIECISIGSGASRRYLDGLKAALPIAMTTASEVAYVRETYDQISYDPAHVLPYLTDVLSSAPGKWSVAWFGIHGRMFEMFYDAWGRMGFTGPVHAVSGLFPAGGRVGGGVKIHADVKAAIAAADAFVVDFSTATGEALGGRTDNASGGSVVSALQTIIVEEMERSKDASLAPRRVIAINAIHNRFESLMRGHIEFARSPFSGRLRHGYVSGYGSGSTPWLGQMTVKAVGERKDGYIEVEAGERGHVVSGPYLSVLPGKYAITIEIVPHLGSIRDWWHALVGLLATLNAILPARQSLELPSVTLPSTAAGDPRAKPPRWKKRGAVAIEVRNDLKILARRNISAVRLLSGMQYRFPFSIDAADFAAAIPPAIGLRVWSGGWIPFSIRRIELEAY